MHKKINMDYIKSKIPQMPTIPEMHLPKNLPKIRSRKVFSTKDNVETFSPPIPHSTVIDRSPSRISTITELVEGQNYHYSLGGAKAPEIDKTTHDPGNSTTEDPSSKRFTQQITKRYKELSEMKFKNFFGKKTIVRKTEIQVDLYKETTKEDREEQRSLQSDYEFEFRSLPPETTYPESEESYPNSPNIGANVTRQPASIPLPSKSESVPAITERKKNESSLWKIKSIKNKLRAPSGESQPNETETVAESKKPSHRIAFDKAKKNMNANFQRLKMLSSGGKERNSSTSQDAVPDKSTEEKSVEARQKPAAEQKPLHNFGIKNEKRIEEVYGKIKRDSNESLENLYNSSTEMRRRNWARRRFLSTSTDSSDSPRCLKSQSSFDTNPPEVTITRPAPPVPQRNTHQLPKWPPTLQLGAESFKDGTPNRRRTFFPEFPLKGHSRKPSIDSLESDSWIPETFKQITKSQGELNIIEENTEAWGLTTPINNLHKTKSIDIFTGEGNDAFDNFDDYLMNEPVVSTATKHFQHHVTKPFVKQTSITRQFADDVADFNTNVNRLISRFDPNPIETKNARSEKIKVTAVVEIKRDTSSDTDSSDEQEAPRAILLANEQQRQQNDIILCKANPEAEETGKDQQRPRPKLQRSKPSEDLALAASIQDDEIFYSFEEDEEVNLHLSHRKIRQVYTIDL